MRIKILKFQIKQETRKGWKLLSTPLTFSLVLLAAPLTMMFLLSFWTQDYLVLNRTFTLNNYIEAFTQPVYQLLFSRSLTISLTVTFFTVLLAYPMAYFISFYGGNRKALWLFLITIPFWTSYLLRMFLWKVILGYNGVLNSFLILVSIVDLTVFKFVADIILATVQARLAHNRSGLQEPTLRPEKCEILVS